MVITNNARQATTVQLLPRPAVLGLIGVRTTKLYELIAKGEFPKPIKIGARSLWPSTAVEAWIQAQIESQSATI